MVSEKDFYPPKEVRKAAEKGLRWSTRLDGEAVDRKILMEARSIIRGEKQKTTKIRAMRTWFAKHAEDKQSDEWKAGTEVSPSRPQVLWALMGGDAGNSWSNDVMRKLERG